MKLVKVVLTNEKEADFYGCPMPSHSHVRSDKPGKRSSATLGNRCSRRFIYINYFNFIGDTGVV